MDRLTYRDSTVPHTNAKGELWEAYSDANYNEVINKLAAWEDTGFSPLEIKSLEGEWNAMRKVVDSYRAAEEQGLLVRLPCKVGDTLFFAQVGREEPFSMRVQGMSISASGNDVILHFGGFPITNAWGSEVGKTLYLTREEAEAALKGGQDDGTA